MANLPFTNDSVPLEKLTPMLRQYVELKAERPDVVLLMRVGDFYEAYSEDAEPFPAQFRGSSDCLAHCAPFQL